MTAEALGYEHFHRLTQQLSPFVPENLLGLSIDHDDLAGPVDHHHGIGRSLNDLPEPPFSGRPLLRLALPVEIGVMACELANLRTCELANLRTCATF
jgi:hypothetical protein